MGNRAGEDHFSLLFSVYCTNDEGMALSFSWFLVKFQDFFFFERFLKGKQNVQTQWVNRQLDRKKHRRTDGFGSQLCKSSETKQTMKKQMDNRGRRTGR